MHRIAVTIYLNLNGHIYLGNMRVTILVECKCRCEIEDENDDVWQSEIARGCSIDELLCDVIILRQLMTTINDQPYPVLIVKTGTVTWRVRSERP